MRDFGITLDDTRSADGKGIRAEVLNGSARARPTRVGESGRVEGWEPVSRVRAREVVVIRLTD